MSRYDGIEKSVAVPVAPNFTSARAQERWEFEVPGLWKAYYRCLERVAGIGYVCDGKSRESGSAAEGVWSVVGVEDQDGSGCGRDGLSVGVGVAGATGRDGTCGEVVTARDGVGDSCHASSEVELRHGCEDDKGRRVLEVGDLVRGDCSQADEPTVRNGGRNGQRDVMRGPNGGISMGRGPNYLRNQAHRDRKAHRVGASGGFDERRWRLEKEFYCTSCVDGKRCEKCETRYECDFKRKTEVVSADAELKVHANSVRLNSYVIPARRGLSNCCVECVARQARCDECEVKYQYRVEKAHADLEQLRLARKNGTYLWRENRPVGQSRVEKFASQRVGTVCSGPNTRPSSAMSDGSGGSGSIYPGSSASQSGSTPASSVTQRSVEDELLIAGLKEQLSELRKNEEAMTKRLNESDASSEVIRQLRRENRAKSDRIDNLTRRLQK